MKKTLLSKNTIMYLGFILFCIFLTSIPVEVQAKLSEMGSNVSAEIPEFTQLAINLAALGGFVSFILGIAGFMTRHKTNIPAGVCGGMCLFGILLIGIVQLTSEGVDSLYGNKNANGLTKIMSTTSE